MTNYPIPIPSTPAGRRYDGNAITALILVMPLLAAFWGGLATLLIAATGASTAAVIIGTATTSAVALWLSVATRHHRRRLHNLGTAFGAA